jgi:predicted LPLAT superfamily acyltransferase
MPRWQGKSRGTPLGYWIFITICKAVGTLPAYLLLQPVALYYFLFSWETSIHIYRYFRYRHEYGVLKSIWKVYHNYLIFGQTLLDKVVVMAGIENRLTYEFDGEQHLRDMVREGRGGMLISAHVGNWEAAGHLLKRLNTRINVVMYDGENQQIKDFLQQVTGGRNLHVILIKQDMSHVFAIGEALQNNELVCLHADRFLEGNKTTTQTFLGEPAHFPTGPFVLAAGFRVPVSFVFAFKESLRHYHFYGSEPLERIPDERKDEYMDRLVSTFVTNLEQKVKLYPEQWFNYFNFWAK